MLALNNHRVVKLLNQKFISSWSLVYELEDYKNSSKNSKIINDVITNSLQKWKFPVQTHIHPFTNITNIVSVLNANNWMEEINESTNQEAASLYEKFLLDSL